MKKQILWLLVSSLMALILILAACSPAAAPTTPTTPTAPTALVTPAVPSAPAAPAQEKPQQEAVKPAAEAPEYGGTLILPQSGDITRWDAIQHSVMGATLHLTNQGLWSGDWAKGPAGGYGTKQTDWAMNQYDRFDLKTGYVAESTKWTVDTAKNEGAIVYQIRQGMHWALNPASEASRLVNGRELTADDVVQSLKRTNTDPTAYIYRANPETRAAVITKTGPWEVTVKVPLTALITTISRFGDSAYMQPPEVITKYGNMLNWKNSVGTGPFILMEYVPGSSASLVRNSNYWMKDPIGPGKGNQLPYLDAVKYLIIPDASTREAALRTGKVDQMGGFNWEEAAQMRKTVPALKELETASGSRMTAAGLRIDRPPFNDIRVRRAMLMATDFKAVVDGLFGGRGEILTWPSQPLPGYEDLYLSLDDPEMPASVKELYVYNPEKAKQLLKEAGFPNGFKTSVLVTSTEVDFFSVWKDMWAKVGVDLKLDVRESAVVSSLKISGQYEGIATGGGADATMFLTAPHLQGEGEANVYVHPADPVIDKALDEVRLAMVTKGEAEAMRLYKELMKYVLDQAYAIPRPKIPTYNFWWPWVKNYGGETSVGYYESFVQWVWLDKELKKSMGY
ncbi:MAG: ABC transporter substrate-binding protein [Chloroflexi bacterium]|nr:ABC transporter substrate-binding protein [Chloroflexota bacterium]